MISKRWLLRHYVFLKKSMKACATELGVYPADISRALKKYRIPARNLSQAYYLAIKQHRRKTTLSTETIKKISEARKGHKRSKESIQKQVETAKKRRSYFGRRPTHSRGYYLKFGDKTIFLRSTYECLYAVFLTKNNLDWEYEPKTFKFPDLSTYTPDFYVENKWIEVKGWLQQRHVDIFRKMKKEFNIDIKLVDKKILDDISVTWRDVEPFIVAEAGHFRKICNFCGDKYVSYKKKSKFCSPKCSSVSWKNKNTVDLICKFCRVGYSKPKSLVNTSKFCSRKCKDSYVARKSG